MKKLRTTDKKNKYLLIEDVIEPTPIRTQSFASMFPEAANLWDYKKNCGFGPEDFSYYSSVQAWFKCSRGKDHSFQCQIGTVTRALLKGSWSQGCGFCRGLRISVTNSLAKRFPHIAKEWMIKKNGCRPDSVSCGSQKKAWWKCSKGHTWQACISNRTGHNSGCTKCNRGAPTDLSDFPTVLAEFDRKKNRGIDPHALPVGRKVHWRCSVDHQHTWFSGFYRTNKDIRCPYCSNKRGSKGNNLGSAHPELAKQWHPEKNKPLKPSDVAVSSCRRVWWKCTNGPDHEWQTKISDRIRDETGCPFCSFRKTSITNVISTVAPHLVKEWNKERNGAVTPDSERCHSRTKRWWTCLDCGHHWQAEPERRIVRGSGCPRCAKLEQIKDLLIPRGIKPRGIRI